MLLQRFTVKVPQTLNSLPLKSLKGMPNRPVLTGHFIQRKLAEVGRAEN